MGVVSVGRLGGRARPRMCAATGAHVKVPRRSVSIVRMFIAPFRMDHLALRLYAIFIVQGYFNRDVKMIVFRLVQTRSCWMNWEDTSWFRMQFRTRYH